MEYETPRQLADRLKLGREEFAQRLLTTLILEAPYPRWNSRCAPSERGIQFLSGLWTASGFESWPGDDIEFVDEFELPPRVDGEKGGAPDYAVLWDDRVWMIELKTEVGSHQASQIPGYFELARHHHPASDIALTYLTPRMEYAFAAPGSWAGYAHVTWPGVAPLIASTWQRVDTPGQREVVDGLLDLIERMETERASDYMASLRAEPVAEASDPVRDALVLAEATADDGRQRALEHDVPDLESLLELRLRVRDKLAASAQESALRCVMPWLWRWESGGRPLTAPGQATGRELRLSRYARPLY